MSKQEEAAKESMVQWLSHENELGKAPSKIEQAGTFGLHDMKYYMFKYKKGMLGKWLLGVCGGYGSEDELEHCGHIYSEMQEYDPSTAEEKSIAMVEMIRRFWIDEAKKAQAAGTAGVGNNSPGSDASAPDEEGGSLNDAEASRAEDGENSPASGFVSFVLLKEPKWDKEVIIKEMAARGFTKTHEADGDGSPIPMPEDSDNDSVLFFEQGGMMIVISIMPAQVPDGEAEKNAATNYFWPDAVEVTKSHKGHIIVAVLSHGVSTLDWAKAFVHANCACLKLDNALGVYTSGTVFEPSFYLNSAEAMNDGRTPIMNLVYFGLYGGPDGMSGYTYGLEALGKDEIEVLNCDANGEELHGFLYSIADYVVTYDVVLQDGETIGFSEEEKLPITRSKAVALNNEMTTVKIGWRPAK